MSLAGTGVVAIWHDLLPEALDDFYQWHNREHMPERVAIPGFLRGRRYIAIEGAPQFFNLYEAESPAVLAGADYLGRLNSPTEWTRRVVPSFRNVARSICAVAYSGGTGSGGTVLTARLRFADGVAPNAIAALAQSVLPAVSERVGIAGVHLCVADDAASRIETAEKKARADVTEVPAATLLVEGIGVDAVRAAFAMLRPSLLPHVAGDVDTAVYRLEYTRLKTPRSAG